MIRPRRERPQDSRVIDARNMWAASRFWMETENIKSKRYGGKSQRHWYALLALTKAFEWGLKATRRYERGVAHAHDIVIRRMEHRFADLPAAFDGFTIMHLSDLHLDGMPRLCDIVIRRIGELMSEAEIDLCVLTGDYRHELHGPIARVLDDMAVVVGGIRARHGIIGILGNHDTCHMVSPFEEMGIRMLINESMFIERGGQSICLVGTDDVHYYYTDQALHALEAVRDAGFTIALVHSPELYDTAEAANINLYLCGHTHAGQICLPGGRPIITHLGRGRRYYRGLWQLGSMRGVTHAGTGTSGIPVRFNTRGEILLHTLRR